ncbi:MAG: homoserine dehydrogenase, partial [Candidatus Desulforudis sp.]|nr:homoserine dehydrogenase [Desulforudis sp.]
MGLGTVGSGVYRVLQSNASLIARKTGARIEVVKILVRDTGKSRGLDIPEGVLTDNPDEVLRD